VTALRALLAVPRATATISLLAFALGLSLLGAPADAAGTVSPLPESNYGVRSACAAPARGDAGCLALELVPETATARAHTHPLGLPRSTHFGASKGTEGALKASENGFGYRPLDLQSAYFPGSAPDAPASEPQTIALVDAYNDLNAEADLSVYDNEFKLPACTAEGKCFQKVNQSGGTGNLPFPKTLKELETAAKGSAGQREEAAQAEGWALEISTDIEMARAICQNCHIVLLEAKNSEYKNLETAENTAVAAPFSATEVSNSWGGREPEEDSLGFNHPGTVITASSGDDGYLNWTDAEEAQAHGEGYYEGANYPASSPHVVAVGGTKLTLSGGSRQSETVWNEDPGPGKNHGAAGGGCSLYFGADEWQLDVPDWSQVGCEGRRAVADIAADADPFTPVAVYDSTPDGGSAAGWVPVGGTSVASPIIASMFALAGGARGVAYPAKTLYSHLGSPSLYDVTAGGNGDCDDVYTGGCSGSMSPLAAFDCGGGELICNAALSYDGPSGVGAPNAINAFRPIGEGSGEEAVEPEGESPKTEGTIPVGESPKGTTGEEVKPGGQTPPSDGAPLPGAVAAGKPLVKLSALGLTHSATAALHRGRPRASLVAFSFTLNMTARVRITLARQIRSGTHLRWVLLPGSLTITAAKGRDSRRLTNHAALPAGRYQLTLAPVHGTARSLTFKIA